MAVTRLKRKGLRNKARAKQRKQNIKELTRMPPINNVDVEAIKAEFAQKSGKPASKSQAEEAPAEPKASQPTATSPEGSATPAEETSKNPPASPEAPSTSGDATAEEVVETAAEDEDRPEVAPDVVSPETGAPDETPSEADEQQKG